MSRPNRRTELLEAAVRVAVSVGPSRLTLDRVAQEAGVSKGGVLYHFSDKRTLLAGLVTHFLAVFEAAIAHEDDAEWARAYLRATLLGSQLDVSVALLSVAATDRALLQPLAVAMQRWRARFQRAVRDPAVGMELMLAADAVWYAQLLGLGSADPQLADHLFARLEAQLDG